MRWRSEATPVLCRRSLAFGMFAAFMSLSNPVTAFDVRTHAVMTFEATAMSMLGRDPNASGLMPRLGLVDYPPSVTARFPTLGESYVDIGTSLITRNGKSIETRITNQVRAAYQENQGIPHDFQLTGWIIRGAIREDDNREETPVSEGGDEPDGVFNRVFGHFFDPQVDRGLTVGGVQLGARAVEWALQPGATVTNLPNGIGSRENHFKILDAREAMWRALTLRKVMPDGTLSTDIFPNQFRPDQTDVVRRESLRKAYWATAFRALGDVVHLLQDMGQPQHTRNDAHSGIGCIPGVGCAGGHDSYFEKHLRARSARERRVNIREGLFGPDIVSRVDILPTNLVYSGYPKPLFNTYGDFFATDINGENAAGRGLANYSNRGFYSFGTNIGSANASQYPSPNPTGSGLGYTIISEPELKDSANRPLTGSVVFRTGAVADNATNTPEPNVKLAAVGAWDQFLQQKNANWGSYTLNYYNYDDQARLLVPRAVAYSAGLIDYFFRGELYVAPPAEGVFGLLDHGDPASNCKDTCGFTKIKLRVANSTPDITPPQGAAVPQGMTGGVVVAVAKFRRNDCYTPALSGEYQDGGGETREAYYARCVAPQPEEIVVSDAVNVSGIPACGGNCDAAAVPYTFNFQSPIPINAASLSLQLVYRGVLGSEADAVVVQTVDVSEPSYYVYMNASDYIKVGDAVYTRAQINDPANTTVRQKVKPVDCIVNDQLRDTCFQPYEVNFPLRWGDPAPTTAIAPLELTAPKQFSRLAMIAPPDQFAVVNQASTPCLPKDPSRFAGQETQERLEQVPGNPPSYRLVDMVSPMNVARGAYTTYGVACVVNGDESTAPSQDERMTTMAPLAGAELVPKTVAGFTYGN